MCRPVLQILTLFQIKKCYFQHPFSDQTSKIQTRFQTWPVGKQKNSANPLKIRTFLFLSYSFGIETINTFIHSRSRSLENHTRFQTNMPQNPYADGAAHAPPPPPSFGPNCSLNPYPESTSDLIQILLKTSRIYSRVRISCKENKSNRGRLVQRCSKLRTTTFCKDLFFKKKRNLMN